MNNQRRKQITKIINDLRSSEDNIQGILDEEQEAFDNIPEGLLESERAEQSQNAIELLDDAINSLEEAINNLEEAQE